MTADECLERARYYQACVDKKWTMPGNDPISGQPRDKGRAHVISEIESAISYQALANYWKEQAEK